MIFLLFIIDLNPSDRKVSLWIATIPYAGGIILASLLADNLWLHILVMLLVFFFAYYLRRYGPRAGELALVASVGYYFGLVLHPPPAIFSLLIVCVFLSAAIVYLWQFAIIPYNPENYLIHSVQAYYHNIALGVAAASKAIALGQIDAPKPILLQRYITRVHKNRRVIEGLFAAAVSPTTWSQPRLNRLQEVMFTSERGLDLLIDAAGKLSIQRVEIPADILQTLQAGLSILAQQLWKINPQDGPDRLSMIGDQLHDQVKSVLNQRVAGDWVFSLQRLGLGARQLAHSVADIRTLEIRWTEAEVMAPMVNSPADFAPTVLKDLQKKAPFSLHPTTILGLQAVLASGLAILAAYLLKMSSPSLVFWTAFMVIAGSTGESLRRMSFRVIGVISGTLVGFVLAFFLPDNLTLTVVLVSTCLFMTIYVMTISYGSMVFWLNVGILLISTSIGGSALDLSMDRILSTLLGAAVAALVVTFVLPIRTDNRFAGALSTFLKSVDGFLSTYVESILGAATAQDLDTEALKIDASYKRLELTLPSMAFEYNPLTRSQSLLASQATSLAVLKGYVSDLNDDVGVEPGSIINSDKARGIQIIQARIHSNLEALILYLAKETKDAPDSVGRPGEAPSLYRLDSNSLSSAASVELGRDQGIEHLLRIHDVVLQIGAGIGLPVSSKS